MRADCLTRRALGAHIGPATLLVVLILVGPGTSRADPFEPFNRVMFSFNQVVVSRILNPAIDTFGPHIPDAVATGLGNAYSNLTEIEFLLNSALVGDVKGMFVSVARFTVNSTLGLAGLFDVASRFGLTRTERDFIESLCSTGVPPGPYLVLPFVGPTNAISAAVLASAVAIEVYALSFISTALAAADFLIIDLGGSASALRYARDLPQGNHPDLYVAQREAHMAYVERGCGENRGQPIVSN